MKPAFFPKTMTAGLIQAGGLFLSPWTRLVIGLLFLASITAGCQRARFENRVWSAASPADQSPQALSWAQDSDFTEQQMELHVGNETLLRKVQKIDGVEVEGAVTKEVRLVDDDASTPVYIAQRKLEGALKFLPRTELLLYRANEDRIRRQYLKNLEAEGLHADAPGKIVIAERDGKFSPELRVEISDPKTGQFFRDSYSLTGVRIERVNVGLSFNAQTRFAQVFPQGPRKSQLAWVPVFWTEASPKLTGTYFSVTSRSGQTLGAANDRYAFALDDLRFDQLQVYYFVENFLNGLRTRHGFQLPLRLQVETHIGYPESSNAALYHQNILRFGTGDGVTYRDLMRDPTVVMHEVAHAVIEALAHLPPQGEGGAINEGVADFLAASYLDTPRMGEDSFIGGPYRRNLDNSKSFDELSGKTYADSEIVSGFLWALRKEWGAEKTEAFTLRLLARLMPDADFATLRAQMHELGAGLPETERAILETTLHERKWQ